MTDYTAKHDEGKLDLTLVPRQIIWDIAEVREYGNKKYGDPDNWKQVEPERYRAAAFRHFLAYLDDPAGRDQESGISHLAHLACNIAFLCEMEFWARGDKIVNDLRKGRDFLLGERAMKDTIYRQDAIDAVNAYLGLSSVSRTIQNMTSVTEILEKLPSAQLEIIYCGDCKYKDDGIDEDGIPFLKCLNGRSYGGTRINDYCSWAERRTDE